MIREGFKALRENKRLAINTDLVVVGGGLAGVCCAITAARQGIQVILVQDRPVLGGNSSSEVRLWILGATSHMGNNNRWAREGGVIDEILVENMYRNKEGNPLMVDSIILEKVVSEPNITLLLNTSVYQVNKKTDDQIGSVVAFCSQNSTTYQLSAPLFCDSSGDGIVAFQSGAAFRMGAESSDEFNEGCAPDIEDYGELLGHTMYFYTKDIGRPVKYVAPSFALQDVSKIAQIRSYSLKDNGCKLWWIEYGGRMDTVHDTEKIKWELWSAIYGIWNHIKNSGKYLDAETLTLEWVSTIPGKRESRRFEGDYMLTQQDIVQQKQHYDAVAHGGWAIDLHPADGLYSHHSSCTQWHSKGIYQIPFRCYYSKEIGNLFLAGRIISASHVAFGSTRVMATCASGGQVVGMAAALANKNGLLPCDFSKNGHLGQLQNELNKAGQSIAQVSLNDTDNLVNTAKISVSSELGFSELKDDGPWLPLEYPSGQMLPLKKEIAYSFQFFLKAEKPAKVEVQFRKSSKITNFTPDITIETTILDLKAGEQWVDLELNGPIVMDQYIFICFMKNDLVSIKGSMQRIPGILSVFNKPNKAVSNNGEQVPPENSGIETFEFWCPERRPKGNNLALKITPAIGDYSFKNMANGLIRPTGNGNLNAWMAAMGDANPQLKFKWKEPILVRELILFFDTDYDHPMESVLYGHPESVMPFCVRNYTIYDALGNQIFEMKDNHQSINKVSLENEITTDGISIKFEKPSDRMPVTVYQVLCY